MIFFNLIKMWFFKVFCLSWEIKKNWKQYKFEIKKETRFCATGWPTGACHTCVVSCKVIFLSDKDVLCDVI